MCAGELAGIDARLAVAKWCTLNGLRDALHRIRDIVRRIADLREVRTKPYATGARMVDLDHIAPAQVISVISERS